MGCPKTCDCTKCEMLMRNEYITIIIDNGLYEKRHHTKGVKCMYTGMYALNSNELKTSKMMDNLVWAEEI